MPLPKIYWDKLPEHRQIEFFNFYMDDIKHCRNCPSERYLRGNFCKNFCTILFQQKLGSGGLCPCQVYGPKTAMAALEKALIDNGWIEDESVFDTDKGD